jgi:hypothetical protein
MTKTQSEQEKQWLQRNPKIDYANRLINQAERLHVSLREPNGLSLPQYWSGMARYHDLMARALSIKAETAGVEE